MKDGLRYARILSRIILRKKRQASHKWPSKNVRQRFSPHTPEPLKNFQIASFSKADTKVKNNINVRDNKLKIRERRSGSHPCARPLLMLGASGLEKG